MGTYTAQRIPETWAAGEGHGDYRDTLPTRTEDVAEQLAGVVQDGRWTFGLFECWGPRERLGAVSHARPQWHLHSLHAPPVLQAVMPVLRFSRITVHSRVAIMLHAMYGAWCLIVLAALAVKKAVHIPCCPSFRFNPFAWRGGVPTDNCAYIYAGACCHHDQLLVFIWHRAHFM